MKYKYMYFQGLEIGLLKFKGFQDAYKPCVYNGEYYPSLRWALQVDSVSLPIHTTVYLFK